MTRLPSRFVRELRAPASVKSRPRKPRLSLHSLEDRSVPATFTVTSIADSGSGSLREAIDSANASGSDDIIDFDPTLFATPQVISLDTVLPTFDALGGAL